LFIIVLAVKAGNVACAWLGWVVQVELLLLSVLVFVLYGGGCAVLENFGHFSGLFVALFG
jgi:hypothetical protein